MTTPSQRIVIIEPDATGGMVHFAYMLGRALAGLGSRVTMITADDYELSGLPHDFEVKTEFTLWPRMDSDRSHPRVDSWPGRLHRKVFRRAWRALRLTSQMWRATGRIVSGRPDIVLVRPFPLPGRGMMLARLKRAGITLIEVSHEFEPRDAVDPLAARLERILAGTGSRSIDLRLFLGASVRDRYAVLHPRIPRSRLLVIPHGDGELFELLADPDADLEGRFGLESEDEVVLFFGNLRPSKGVGDLLDAFASAKRPHRAKLLVVGYPSPDVDAGALVERARRLGIADAVRFDFGYLPNELVAPMYRLARFVALPYRSATQSGPLHVAMTFGKPVLATRTGGMVDVIEDEVNGLLVEPGDIPALSAALERMMSDDDLIARLSAAVTEDRARFRWSVVAGRLLELAGTVGPEPR